MIKRIWQDFWSFVDEKSEIVQIGLEASQSVLELAQKIQEFKDAAEIAPLARRISSLLDLLNSPPAQVLCAGIPFATVISSILKLYSQSTKKPADFESCVALIVQAAYLESYIEILGLPENKILFDQIAEKPSNKIVAQRIASLGEPLKDIKLEKELKEAIKRQKEIREKYQSKKASITSYTDDDIIIKFDTAEAVNTINFFRDSRIASCFNRILYQRFIQAGLNNKNALILTKKISCNTHKHILLIAVNADRDSTEKLTPFLSGLSSTFDEYQNIESYLKNYISNQPKEKIFQDEEDYSYQDIYVPIMAVFEKQLLSQNSCFNKEFLLDVYAQEILVNPLRENKLLLIKGAPGAGKSVFCRLFSERVRQKLSPIWIPILIKLREVRGREKSFDNIIELVLKNVLKSADSLYNKNHQFVFIVDGFDELVFEEHDSVNLANFLQEASSFQTRFPKHQVILTGRIFSLFDLGDRLPNNYEIIRILPMNDTVQSRWFDRWKLLVGQEKSDLFKQFIKNANCPLQVKQLAREPLLLYLLAVMHRDERLTSDIFCFSGKNSAKALIYEAVLFWVLTKQRSKQLNLNLTELNTEGLLFILSEAGLCIIQSRQESILIDTVEDRLNNNEQASLLLEASKNRFGQDSLKNSLVSFYFQSADQDAYSNQEISPKPKGFIEFSHKSFGEFLFARKILEFLSSDSNEYYGFYDLLGYGRINIEILDFILGLITKENNLDIESKISKLWEFYDILFDKKSNFISDNRFAIKKSFELKDNYNVNTDWLEVYVVAYLNVLILLVSISRINITVKFTSEPENDANNDDANFHPCKSFFNSSFDKFKLFRLISLSTFVDEFMFARFVGQFSARIDLSKSFLAGANLEYMNFSNSNFRSAFLKSASLRSALLSNANLEGANLEGANLKGANLKGANLEGANLEGANLYKVNLENNSIFRVNLYKANMARANLKNTHFKCSDLSSITLNQANIYNTYLKTTPVIFLSELKTAYNWEDAFYDDPSIIKDSDDS